MEMFIVSAVAAVPQERTVLLADTVEVAVVRNMNATVHAAVPRMPFQFVVRYCVLPLKL